MKKLLYICVAFLTVFALSSFLPTEDEISVYDGVIRLHILADSDSKTDQALKLYVRDEILDDISRITSDAKTKKEAEAAISTSLNEICDAATAAVRSKGSDATVSVTLSEEKYPRRSYGAVVLPSGTYTSLRVMLGEAKGANWWCVLFPDICTSPAIKNTEAPKEDVAVNGTEEKFVEAGFTPSQYKLITRQDEPRYVIKFRIVEIIEALFGK